MSWRDRLRPASFRGVPFFVLDGERDSGRRVALHQYPFRDLPYAEDLGLKAGQFQINCLTIGKDYDVARNALEAALDQYGPGTLVLPTRGTSRVVVMDYRTSETTREGGVCRISVTFAEAGAKIQPAAVMDTAAVLDSQATAVVTATQSDFATIFETEGHPQWVADASQDLVQDLTDSIESLSQRFPRIPEQALVFRKQLNDLSNDLAALIRSPSDLADSVASLIGGLGLLVDRPLNAVAMYRSLFAAGSDAKPVPTTTPTRQQQADNQTAVIDLFRRTAVAEAARSASQADFQTADDALALRDELSDQMDTLGDTAPDAVYNALVDLRAALVKDIANRGALLPRVAYYTPPTTLPALVIAYQVHGDPTRESQIIARNKIRHPLFVPGGTAVEVLND